jgi:glyoxalase family protein
MHLHGIHHVTAITADAPRNVDFYARLLGLRLIKKTVNFDSPDVYHLYYGDEEARPGSVLTFFEFPDAARGRPGAGMVHRVVWRVAGEAALDFWADRLRAEDVPVERDEDGMRFSDFEGLAHELRVVQTQDAPLRARAAGIPEEHALLGFDEVRALASDPDRSRPLLVDALGFGTVGSDAYRTGGEDRHARYAYDPAPSERARPGAGTVHHVAWTMRDEDQSAWGDRARRGGVEPTPVIDRNYFRSIYFREPSGVLFELATPSPGFTRDEPLESLGEALMLPERYEPRREELERKLTPLVNPRTGVAR